MPVIVHMIIIVCVLFILVMNKQGSLFFSKKRSLVVK